MEACVRHNCWLWTLYLKLSNIWSEDRTCLKLDSCILLWYLMLKINFLVFSTYIFLIYALVLTDCFLCVKYSKAECGEILSIFNIPLWQSLHQIKIFIEIYEFVSYKFLLIIILFKLPNRVIEGLSRLRVTNKEFW